MNEQQILNLIKQLLIDVAQSPRWVDPDSPAQVYIADIGERVNSIDSLREFRKNDDYLLLLDIANQFEASLNDDWLPYEIFGLKLDLARQFIVEIIDKFDVIQQGQWTIVIKEIHDKVKTNHNTRS